MAAERKLARVREFESKAMQVQAEAELARVENEVIAAAYAGGKIDGKNADERKRQESSTLVNDAAYQAQVMEVRTCEATAQCDQAEREYQDDLVSLTKAWLYSQRGD